MNTIPNKSEQSKMAPRCVKVDHCHHHDDDYQRWGLDGGKDPVRIECAFNGKTNTFEPVPSRRNSRVRFSNNCEITHVPGRNDLPLDELYARWFNEEDYEDVHVENQLTEAVMNCEENKHLVDDELLCARGLTDNESLEARAEKSSFVQKLVLNQFAFHSNQGKKDCKSVAKIYHDCSQPAVQRAREVAQRDQEDAMKYHDTL